MYDYRNIVMMTGAGDPFLISMFSSGPPEVR